MYLRYFALQDHPFAITPDPAFLYLSGPHREGLGHLLYGTGEHGGFVQLTGEVGTGKTTLIRALLEQEQEVADVDVALCLNPQLTVYELLAGICDELGVDYHLGDGETVDRGSLKYLIDRLNAHLLQTHAAGRRTVVIIDEAQNLSREVLEQVRLLTNLETGKHKLLRIILVGQPELEDLLARPDLRQLAQRITARYHLKALNRAETFEYIRHRLQVAGGDPDIFPSKSCATVYRMSAGTPRLINTICERALMGAYANGRKQVSPAMVRHAAAETLPRASQPAEPVMQQLAPVAVLVAATFVALGLHFFITDSNPSTSPVIEQVSANSNSSPAENHATENEGDEGEVAESKADESVANASSQSRQAGDRQYELPESSATLSQLLRLWGVFGAEVKRNCLGLKIGDLRCLQDNGSFAEIESFNRPALITLQAGDRSRQALLTNLNDGMATLVTGDGISRWPRRVLTRFWTGEFQMVWRLHTSTSRIASGSVGDSVTWLRRQLASAQGRNLDAVAGPPSPVFDKQLEREVRQFQSARGLEVDGVVGGRTMTALSNLSPPPGTPLLNSKQGSSGRTASKPDASVSADTVGEHCIAADRLPPTRELARFAFAANSTDLPDEAQSQLDELASGLRDQQHGVFVVGTSFNPSMAPGQLRALATRRAEAVARRLAAQEISRERIHCIAKSGERAPDASLDRVAVVYRSLAAAQRGAQ